MVFKNVITPTLSNREPLSIWFVHDNKPGHTHQLQGIEERITSYCDTKIHWIDATQTKLSWFNLLIKSKTTFPTPDIVIGAGHKTHKALLIYAKAYKAYSAVLMKPSLPMSWFDAIICPKHDGVQESKCIMNTFGALNTINPTNNTVVRSTSLMLIGGPSKHFKWQENKLLEQIKKICAQDTSVHWILSDSPRTPSAFLPKLEALQVSNLSYYHYLDTKLKPLHELMLASEKTWVTPDSVSMIYESLTARTPTFTFTLPAANENKPSRIKQALDDLIKQKHVMGFEDWQLHRDIKPNKLDLWEADRAAKWLLNRYVETHPNKK